MVLSFIGVEYKVNIEKSQLILVYFLYIFTYMNIKDIQIKPQKTKPNEPYVSVDFSWFHFGRNVDPNSMDTIHIQDAIQCVTKLVDDGNKSEIEGERLIKGFRQILDARLSDTYKSESTIYRQIKEMDDPILSVLNKTTGEVIDLELIPYSVVLDLIKKYYK